MGENHNFGDPGGGLEPGLDRSTSQPSNGAAANIERPKKGPTTKKKNMAGIVTEWCRGKNMCITYSQFKKS